jgi:hypothetical protein
MIFKLVATSGMQAAVVVLWQTEILDKVMGALVEAVMLKEVEILTQTEVVLQALQILVVVAVLVAPKMDMMVVQE